MSDYYKVDSRKVTLREYWNILPSWKVLIPWIFGRLNVRMGFGSGFRQPENVKELEVPEAEFSSSARLKLQPHIDQFLQLGFHSPRYYTFEMLQRETRTSFIVLLHSSGEISSRLMYTVNTQANPPHEDQLLVLLSELSDGTYFFTSNQRAKFKSPPGVHGVRLIGASPGAMLETHLRELNKRRATNPPKPLPDLASMDEVWDRYEKHSVNFGIQRGLYEKMKPEEVAQEQQITATVQSMTTPGGDNADVLLALSRLQNKKASWTGAIIILLISLGLFVGAGAKQWTWEYVAILVPVLFIHELGHYLAMRAFNYRNLRMFFIPFFGAAVSGQHYNVPGWKKVIVSLMGPVPGILMGATLGGVGLVLSIPVLTKIALVTLILNGFNLLPLLPLDGGWVFHALLFCRHYWLDTVFRVVAALGLIALGMFSSSKLTMYLGIPMLIAIPMAYKNARIAWELHRRGITEASADAQTIPPETANVIIAEVRKNLPTKHTAEMVAQRTLQIFETLNARPPGWIATVGLLFVHFVSLGMAVVFSVFFIVGQSGDLSRLWRRNANTARHLVDCQQLQFWNAPSSTANSQSETVTLVANFNKSATAQSAFQTLTNELPKTASLQLFGNSLFLMLPAEDNDARKKWFSDLQGRAKDVFVDTGEFQPRLTASCLAPSETAAEALEAELDAYFKTGDELNLIPPWHPHDRRTPDERQRHAFARETYIKMLQVNGPDDYDTSEFSALQKQINRAQRQGDKEEVKALQAQVSDLLKQKRRHSFDRILGGANGPVDTNTARLYLAYADSVSQTNSQPEELRQQLAAQMGAFPPRPDGKPTLADLNYSVTFGIVSRDKARLHFAWLGFQRVGHGAPALVEWLCARGCSDFKYAFAGNVWLKNEDVE